MSTNQTTGERTVTPAASDGSFVRALGNAASASRPADRVGQLAQPTDGALTQRSTLGRGVVDPTDQATKPENPNPNNPSEPLRMDLASLAQLHEMLLVRRRTKKGPRTGDPLQDDTYMVRTKPEDERLPEDELTAEKLQKYLWQLEQCGTIHFSCTFAGLSCAVVKKLRDESEEFRERHNAALERFRENLHAIVLEKAKGWDVPIIGGKFRDEIVAYERKHDSRMLELMIKRHDPNFRERTEVGVSVTGGVLVVPAPALSSADWLKQNGGEKLPERELIDMPPLPPSATEG